MVLSLACTSECPRQLQNSGLSYETLIGLGRSLGAGTLQSHPGDLGVWLRVTNRVLGAKQCHPFDFAAGKQKPTAGPDCYWQSCAERQPERHGYGRTRSGRADSVQTGPGAGWSPPGPSDLEEAKPFL